jgi:hypothetical protein
LDTYLNNNNQNKYIIVYKDIFSWLVSIEKWAIKCNWKQNKKMQFIEDYLQFIKKWIEIKNNRVLFISYHEYLDFIITKNKNFELKLCNFLQNNGNPNKIYKFQKVNCSSDFNQNNYLYYINKVYMNSYTDKEIDEIKENPIYKKIIEELV